MWKRLLLLTLCVCFLVHRATADPLYRTTRRFPDSDAILLASRAQPWRRSSSSGGRRRPVYRPPTNDYSSRFLDFELLRRDSRARVWSVNFKSRQVGKLSWTSRLVYANVLMFALQAFRPGITARGMKLSEKILRGEELYRLVTPVFLHGGILHLMTNMISLQRTGNDLEKLFGPARYLATYVVAGAVGNYFSAVRSPNPSLGASGAVFGVFGAYFVFLSRNEWLMGGYGQAMTNSITQTVAANLFLGAMNPVIDNWAHLGGALGGAAMAYVFGPRLYLTDIPNVGRVVVDRPVYRLPRTLEKMASKTQKQVERLGQLVPFGRFRRSRKPWRGSANPSKIRIPTPNRSIKPREIP